MDDNNIKIIKLNTKTKNNKLLDIILIGEYHNKNYIKFFNNFLDELYDINNKFLIILEKNENFKKSYETDIFFKNLFSNDKINKKKQIKEYSKNPIEILSIIKLYSDGSFVNKNNNISKIIFGDIRVKSMFDISIEIFDKLNTIDLNQDLDYECYIIINYLDIWKYQINLLNDSVFEDIKTKINNELIDFFQKKKIKWKEFEEKYDRLSDLWITIFDYNVKKIINKTNEYSDIIIFTGNGHLKNLELILSN